MTYTYTIRDFNANTGTMVVEFDGFPPRGYNAPHDGTSYLSGDALEAEIQKMYPTFEVNQKQIISRLTNLENIQALVNPYPQPSAADVARNRRSALLYSCDWTQSPDSPLTTEQKTAWATYRQQLRDITSQSGFPDTINWPTAPV
jgi:hypothetical protein